MITLAEIVAAFRSIAKPHDNTVILGDEDAARVLVAWQHAHRPEHWRMPRGRMPPMHDPNAAWRWTTSTWRYEVEEIANGAGVSIRVASEKMTILIHNRLCYPDGSIADAAVDALQAHIAIKFGIKPKTKTKTADKKPDDKKATN